MTTTRLFFEAATVGIMLITFLCTVIGVFDWRQQRHEDVMRAKTQMIQSSSLYYNALVGMILGDHLDETTEYLEQIKEEEGLNEAYVASDAAIVGALLSQCNFESFNDLTLFLVPACTLVSGKQIKTIQEIKSAGTTLGYLVKGKTVQGNSTPIWSKLFFGLILWLMSLLILGFLYLWQLRRHLIKPLKVLSSNAHEVLQSLDNQKFALTELQILSKSLSTAHAELHNLRLEKVQQQANEDMARIASQVAHDIRSPLAALEIASAHTAELPEEKRILIRNAVSRIRDIANNLVARGRQKTNEETEGSIKLQQPGSYLMSSLLEELLTEKRLQYRSMMGIEIEANVNEASYGLFAKIQPIEFKRVLSNLVNNAVEALEGKGAIALSLHGDPHHVFVTITDNGKGIPPEILPKLMQRGKTFGKEGGSGLGLAHAKEMVESWGGRVEIVSEMGKGTTLKLILPRERAPDWFVPKLEIKGGTTVVILDDDLSIHQVWDNRFQGLNLEVIHFSTPYELKQWHQHQERRQARYLCDYELLGQKETGLDVVRHLGIQDQSILVTSRYEEREVLEQCFKLGVKLIPKSMAGFIPIVTCEARHPELVEGSRKHQNCNGLSVLVIDDDPLIGLAWRSQQETLKIGQLQIYSNMEKCTSNGVMYSDVDIAFIDKNIPETTWSLEQTITHLKSKGVKKIIIASGESSADLKKDIACQHADHILSEKIPKSLEQFL